MGTNDGRWQKTEERPLTAEYRPPTTDRRQPMGENDGGQKTADSRQQMKDVNDSGV